MSWSSRVVRSRGALLLAVVLAVPGVARGEGGGPIQTAGARLAREAARQERSNPATPVGATPATARAFRDEQPSGLARSGMGRGKKIAIGLGLALAFAAGVWAIDRGVEDNTPSSRGLR